jgi:hypothetical protein
VTGAAQGPAALMRISQGMVADEEAEAEEEEGEELSVTTTLSAHEFL